MKNGQPGCTVDSSRLNDNRDLNHRVEVKLGTMSVQDFRLGGGGGL